MDVLDHNVNAKLLSERSYSISQVPIPKDSWRLDIKHKSSKKVKASAVEEKKKEETLEDSSFYEDEL